LLAVAAMTVSLVAAVEAGTPSSTAVASGPLTWWALGDSYSAGEGLRNNDIAANPPGTVCERATGTSTSSPASGAYAVVARDLLADQELTFDQFQLKACTGAITNEWRNQWNETSGTQADLITLSMGGNNIGFADVVMDCVGISVEGGANFIIGSRSPAGLAGGALVWGLNPSLGCNTSENELRRRIDMLVGNGPDPRSAFDNSQALPDMYREIAEEAVKPGGHVVVLGYPNLVEESGKWTWRLLSGNRCHRVRRADANMIRSVTGYLNQQIALAVQAADGKYHDVRFHWLDVSQIYENDTTGHHGLCTGQPWLNGLVLSGLDGPDAGNIPFRIYRSFHPNQLGHDATGKALAQLIPTLQWPNIAPSETSSPTTPPPDGFTWPVDDNEGPSVLYVWLGADFSFPDWVSCSQNFCIVGVGDQVRLFDLSDGIDDKGSLSIDTADPRQVFVDAGYPAEQVDEFMAAGPNR
jgi:hypothetical protein